MEKNIVDVIDPKMRKQIDTEIKGLTFTKNFRSPSAEEWYVFLPSYKDPITGVRLARLLFTITYMIHRRYS